MNVEFRDRVVIVTRASLGIGAATARAFAEHGTDVAICARRLEPLENQAALIRNTTGRRCLAIQADVTDSSQMRQ
jgi:NADP-dependent 3-hydroxy acid dehydrogenase YdfG